MFEVLVQERAYFGIVNTVCTRGEILYKRGVHTDGNVLLDLATDSSKVSIAMYPINRINMREDLADTNAAIDGFVQYDKCIYYEGGTFRSDKIVLSATPYFTPADYSTPTFPTDTGLYTYGKSGSFVNLWVSTQASYLGWLDSTARCFTSSVIASKNVNFELLRLWSSSPLPLGADGNARWICEYRVKPSRVGVQYMVTSVVSP